uniref:Neurotransmitter-gated ion-channel transmembrane domain-containing protein n=1 Tax=Chromulina nebulosa TaxID=96789 RepID=A0A7S0XBM5_9STRA
MPLEDVLLEPKSASECCLEHHVTHEWTLSEHCMKVYETDALSSSVGKRYSTLYITVLTQRRPNWFIANIFMPSLFLSLVSLLAYTIDSDQVGERNEIVLATLMALIANKNIVSSHMPNVDYHTMVDIYLDCCFLLQVLTLFTNCILKYLQSISTYTCYITPTIFHWFIELFFNSLNIQFFILQVFMFLMLHLWIFLTLSEHREHVEQWINKAQTMQDAYDVSKLPLSHASSEDYKSTSAPSISVCNENSLINSLSCGPPSPKKSHKSVTMSLDPTYFHIPNDFNSVEKIVKANGTENKLQSPTGSTPKARFTRPTLTRRDSFTAIEEAITKEVIVKLRKWFPKMIIKDETHFTNYGASTLVPVTSRDVVNFLEEKAYIKKKRTLKQQITSTVNEQAELRMKTIFAGNRLKAIRATANTKEDFDALRNGAALVLQTLWRTKRTKQRYLKHKEEMNANILESYARKIQRLFRQRKKQQNRRRNSNILLSESP